MEVEAIARLVYDRLETMRAGRVLAVWPDGTVTEEGFGFPGQRRRGDGWESAVTSFPAGTQMSYYDMLQRLLARLRVLGLMAPEEADEAADG